MMMELTATGLKTAPPQATEVSRASGKLVEAATKTQVTEEIAQAPAAASAALPSSSGTSLGVSYDLAIGRIVTEILDRETGAPLASYPTPMMLQLYRAAAEEEAVAHYDLKT